MGPPPESASIYDEFMTSDPATGERTPMRTSEKEKLYLNCLDAFYNEDGKQILQEAEYEQLKLDLEFSSSKVVTYSADEIRFLIANKRFKQGSPVLSDAEYDALRTSLKAAGSEVVLHEGPKCSLETGVCKTDMRVDNSKNRLLYLPGFALTLVALCELSFWTLHLDPLASIALAAVPSYFLGNLFTENVFAQKPLITQTSCPNCNYLLTVYFGDLFSVRADGLISDKDMSADGVSEFVCPNCKEELTARREEMIVSTKPKAV